MKGNLHSKVISLCKDMLYLESFHAWEKAIVDQLFQVYHPYLGAKQIFRS